MCNELRLNSLKKMKNYLKKCNVNAVLKSLTNNMEDKMLPLNNETLNSLKEKHSESKNANNDVLLTGVPQRVHPIVLAGIDEEIISESVIKTKGGPGP